ncbi:hypothetical protein MTO96_039272 [Rhipicephalus appendiculatus]
MATVFPPHSSKRCSFPGCVASWRRLLAVCEYPLVHRRDGVLSGVALGSVWVRATAAVRRSTGPTLPLALHGTAPARGADGADTSRESAAVRRSRRLVVKAHRRVTTVD